MSGGLPLPKGLTQGEALAEALSRLEAYLSELCGGDDPVITAQTRRMVLAGGKRLRPRLVWLCGRMGGASTGELLPLMAILELMHTASLIHDDVVDAAQERRGAATIHTQIGAGGAVQCGDFLLARAMGLLDAYQGTGIGAIIAETFSEMCRGELEQALAVRDPARQTPAGYFRQIKRKTARLLCACCQTGALAGGLDPGQTEALRRYGLHLGMAFQLRDDLLDFAPACRTGKPWGQDLRRGIYTLPVFYALRGDPDLARSLTAPVRTDAALDALLRRVRRSGALEHTQRMARRAADAALRDLAPLAHRAEADALAGFALALAAPATLL